MAASDRQQEDRRERFLALLTTTGLTQKTFRDMIEKLSGARLMPATTSRWATGVRSVDPLALAVLELYRQQQSPADGPATRRYRVEIEDYPSPGWNTAATARDDGVAVKIAQLFDGAGEARGWRIWDIAEEAWLSAGSFQG